MRAELEQPAPPQIYLVLQAGPTALDRLQAALALMSIATVLIAPAADAPLDATTVKPLVDAAQQADVAALIADDARLARTVRADGVHLSHSEALAKDFEEAREILGARAIVGISAGQFRHDVMELAEAGADYVAFGVQDAAIDRSAAQARRLEMIAWWAEIFEIPCVAFDVTSTAEAAELARAGADFLAVLAPGGLSVADTAERLRAILDAAATAIGTDAT